MSEEQPRVIHIRAGNTTAEQGDLAGLIGRIMRESIASNNQRFILQLAHDQRVLNTLQAWKTLKQLTNKQGMAVMVAGGSEDVRDMANTAGFPLVGTAELQTIPATEAMETMRTRVLGYTLPQELGSLNFEQMSNEYRRQFPDPTVRTVGGFIDFMRQKANKTLSDN